MQVSCAKPGDSDKSHQKIWDQALQKLQADHHAFSWNWRQVLSASFGHQPYYFLAADETNPAESNQLAILPVYHFKSPLFGEALISLPYLNAGGVLANSQEACDAVLDSVSTLAKELKVSYLELRHNERVNICDLESEQKIVPGAIDETRKHKVTMQLTLFSDPEELFSSFPPKLRSQIRRPTKSGLYAESLIGSEIRAKHIDEFYSVFSEHMRDLGTPVYPKSLFKNTCREFSNECRLILVRNDRRAIAVGLTVGSKSRTEILWASSLRSYNKLSPNMLLYWEAIKGAVADGYSTFDFGRSTPDSGTYRFKKQWGARKEELSWHYQLYQGQLPDVSPENPKFQFLVSCWKRLPLPLANIIGPFLTRGIP